MLHPGTPNRHRYFNCSEFVYIFGCHSCIRWHRTDRTAQVFVGPVFCDGRGWEAQIWSGVVPGPSSPKSQMHHLIHKVGSLLVSSIPLLYRLYFTRPCPISDQFLKWYMLSVLRLSNVIHTQASQLDWEWRHKPSTNVGICLNMEQTSPGHRRLSQKGTPSMVRRCL